MKGGGQNIIEIKHRFNYKDSYINYVIINTFMNILNDYISLQTKLNYHAMDIDMDGTISIPVDILSNNDIKDERERFDNVIKQVKQYLEKDINYNVFGSVEKAKIASFMTYKIDWANAFYINVPSLNYSTPIKMKKPNISELIIDEHVFKDKSQIIEIINPYITDGLILVDFSVPYNELGFGYNTLHFFEHMNTTPWAMMNTTVNNNLEYYNGFTSSVGHCYDYCYVKDQKTFEKYLYTTIKFIIESRNLNFWQKHKNDLIRETSRTISETKNNASLGLFAKSSGSAYGDVLENKTYLDAIKYWSNRPFKIFIRHPFTSLKLNTSLIEKLISMNKINKLEKPKIETFDYYPYELLINYSYLTRMTSRHSSSEIAKIHYEAINHDKIVNGLFGIDVKTEINNPSEYDDEFDDNTRVFQFYPIFILSTLHDYYDKHEYKELVAYVNVQWTNNNEITRDKTIVK